MRRIVTKHAEAYFLETNKTIFDQAGNGEWRRDGENGRAIAEWGSRHE